MPTDPLREITRATRTRDNAVATEDLSLAMKEINTVAEALIHPALQMITAEIKLSNNNPGEVANPLLLVVMAGALDPMI
jgi:hypothetical protein